MHPPHISISAVTDPDHVDPLIDQFAAQPLGSFGHVGVISYLTHNGTPDGQPHPIEKFEPRTVSSIAHLNNLISRVGTRALSVLHMDCVNYEASGGGIDAAHSTKELPYHPLAPSVTRLLEESYRSGLCRTLQINGLAKVDDLDALLQAMPELRVIASIGPSVAKNGLPAVLEYIGNRRAYIQDILLDLSVGQGTEVRPAEAGAQLSSIYRSFPGLGLGVAGGLGADNAEELVQQVRKHSMSSAFSIDAESGLRGQGNILSLEKTAKYIAGAANGFTLS